MALRTINGTIRDRSGNAYPNGLVLFKLEESVYSTSATYLAGTTQAVSSGAGNITVQLWGPATYQVIEPNDTTYSITVPDGDTGTPLQLEVLRAAGNPTAEPQSTFDEMLDTTLGEDVVDALLATLEATNPPSADNPFVTEADIGAISVGLEVNPDVTDGISVWLIESVEATPLEASVNVASKIDGAETKSLAWCWVRAQVHSGGSSAVEFSFGGLNKFLTVNTFQEFLIAVPIASGAFDVTATGEGSDVTVNVFPIAVL